MVQKKVVAMRKEDLARMLEMRMEMLDRMGIDLTQIPSAARDAIRPLPARQKRSLETVERLLDAAEEILAEKGYEAATVPAIAAKAGLSVGVVYRRFPDKDAMIRAAWGRFFARSLERSQRWLKRCGPPPRDLEGSVRWLVANLLSSYRENRRILRALTMYTRTHPDPMFRKEAELMNEESLRLTGNLLLPHRDRIRHPDPEKAIRYGLIFVSLAVREIILARHESMMALFVDEDDLEDELTRMLLGYLGVEAKSEIRNQKSEGSRRPGRAKKKK